MSTFRFVKLKRDHLDLLFRWRTSENVSRFMLTQASFDIQEHYKWFERVTKDPKFRYWVIEFNNTPIGLLNLANIDETNRHLSAGYYIGEIEYCSLGAMVTPYLYNYVFTEMKFRKIYGEVVGGNVNVLKIHAMHGFREVGTYREHLFKDGCFHDIVLIELLSEDWLQKKKFEKYVASFEL